MEKNAVLRREKPVARVRRARMDEKKSVAKMGMTLSLGALVVTGLMQGRGAKILHIWSGMALVGFSVWHHCLYHPSDR
jgi:hypothetical protein